MHLFINLVRSVQISGDKGFKFKLVNFLEKNVKKPVSVSFISKYKVANYFEGKLNKTTFLQAQNKTASFSDSSLSPKKWKQAFWQQLKTGSFNEIMSWVTLTRLQTSISFMIQLFIGSSQGACVIIYIFLISGESVYPLTASHCSSSMGQRFSSRTPKFN